jgi:hypothetical protein
MKTALAKLTALLKPAKKTEGERALKNDLERIRKTNFIYDRDELLDDFLCECLNFEIVAYKMESALRAEVLFSNGVRFEYWNGNRFFAWLSEGKIGGYTYTDSSVSKDTMIRFYTAVYLFRNSYLRDNRDKILRGEVSFYKYGYRKS